MPITTLDATQSKIATFTEGPALVVSGPGSGKTRVITARAAHLAKHVGIPPESLFVVTFTKAAAEEMKERIQAAVGEELACRMHVQTIHSLAYKFLARRGQRLQVQDENEQRARILSIVNELDLPKEFVDLYLVERANCLNRLIPLERYQPTSLQKREFQQISQNYQEQKNGSGFMDYDDLLLEMHSVLLRLPKLPGRYLMVDEFQDTSLLQYEILKLLATPTNHFFAVGDDDQSIYSWRGATNVPLQFVQDFPGARKMHLNVNYRSSKQIVSLASKLIGHNKARLSKDVVAHGKAGLGSRPSFLTTRDEKAEAKHVVQALQKAFQKGMAWDEMAVLYRINNQGVLIQDELVKARIPFQVLGGDAQILDHSVTKALLSYLKAALYPRDGESLFYIVNRPGRYISTNAIAAAQALVARGVLPRTALLQQDVGDASMKNLHKLFSDLETIKGLGAKQALDYIRKSVGFDEFLRNVAATFSLSLEEYQQVADTICMLADAGERVEGFLDHFRELATSPFRRGSSKGVTLATCHAAKGLEFEFVLLIGAVEGLLPHTKALENGDATSVEEERRLAYVAITRSKDHLLISSPRQVRGNPAQPSRYIGELRQGLVAPVLAEGQSIEHPTWGFCHVVAMDHGIVHVKKPNGETVKLALNWLEERGLL